LSKPGRLEYLKSNRRPRSQQPAKYGQTRLVLFAPGGGGERDTNPIFKHYIARVNGAFGRQLVEFPIFAFLNGAILTGADLGWANLLGASIAGANLMGANLMGANLIVSSLNGALFDGANLTRASLDLASLDGASLDGANLDGARLDLASLDGARLDGARLDGARLDGADLRGAFYLTREQVESAWIDERTKLPEELERIKPEILERQRLRESRINKTAPLSPGAETEAPEEKEEE
jgi:hypothetical protein